MINKRLLIKNLLTHNDENSFYDNKLKISLDSKEGKAKFLKHVCALSNSNPQNNSYIVIGIEDQLDRILGVDFFDDSKIQNLIDAYLTNPPQIQYENVPFPGLPRHKVVGLVTIRPNNKVTALKKQIWKYVKGKVFFRRGSNSMSTLGNFELKSTNSLVVESIEKNARNNIQLTLDGVFDFFNRHNDQFNPSYQVFNEQFVLCWAGKKKRIGETIYYSRVDIELINEQVRLFYSAQDEVKISFNSESFNIMEYVFLGLNEDYKYYPLEKTVIHFKNNGKLAIAKELLFNPPRFEAKALENIFANSNTIFDRLKKNGSLSEMEMKEVNELPTNYMVCMLNEVSGAAEKLTEIKPYLKDLEDKTAYIKYKEALRVLRKVKYQ
jgi:hypothetical protein